MVFPQEYFLCLKMSSFFYEIITPRISGPALPGPSACVVVSVKLLKRYIFKSIICLFINFRLWVEYI